MFNAGVRGKRAKDGVGFLSTAEQFNQKSFLVPTVTSFSITDVSYVPLDNTAVDPAGGEIIVINGSGFATGATVQVGATTIGSVTFIDQNRLAFSAPALSSGSYTIYVTNSNGGTGILLSGLVYSGLPTFTTTAGTLGTVYETANINTAVVATGDAPITYSVISGTLPSGATLNSNGTITGNAPVDGSSTTYSFTIQATDAQLQDSTRAFTLTINTDVLTWGLANNTVYTLDGGTAMSNVTLSATSAANSNSAVTFAANTLPTGVSLSGNTIFGTPTTEQTVYSTLTATATQTGRTATRFVSWVVSVSDLFFKYTTLAIQGADTTFVDDASTNNFAVTIAGDTKPNSFNPYTPGYYSNYFDGLGDWLTIPNNTGFAFGSGAFTVEMWVYIAGSSGTVANYSNGQSSNSNFGWELYQVNTTTMQFSVFEGATQYISSSTSFKQNAWNHIACVRSSNTLTTYVNGVAGGTTANVTGVSINDPASATLKLCSYGNGSDYVTGYISNFRVVKGTAVYTAAFTPSTTPLTAISGTSILTCQSNRFIDTSTNALTITVTGNTLISSFDPFTPNTNYSTYGSAYSDGTGDYISVSNNSNLAFGTGDYTIEMWLYLNSSAQASLWESNPIGTTGSRPNGFIWYMASGVVYLFFSSNNRLTSSANVIPLKQWSHVALVRNSGTTNFYVNGVSVASTSFNYDSTNGAGIVGAFCDGGTYSIDGYISNLRAVKGTAVYTTTFTPPSAPLTAIANTQLLTLQNNQPVNNSTFLDNSTNNFLVTRFGNTTQGTFSPYGGNWSNYFDGSTNGYSIANNAAFNLSTGAFTIECWVFPTAMTTYHTVLSNRSAVWEIGLVSNTFYWYVGSTVYSTTISVPTNQWTHVASSSDGTNVKLFVNGVLDRTITGATPGGTSSTLYIANATNSQWFPGYISNLRIVKGTALYTSNFTPSTTPLTVVSGTSLLTCADNRVIDDSINNFTITKIGNASVQRFSPFNPSLVTPTSYSGYFDGTGDYLTVPNNTAFSFGTGDFTVEAWVNLNSTASRSDMVGGSAGNSFDIQLVVPGNLISVGRTNSSYDFQTTYAFSLGVWTHVALSRSSGTIRCFVNGILLNSASNSIDYSQNGGTTNIGAASAGEHYLNGYMSNLRVVKGTALYTANFTPSTTPLTAVAGTSLLTCQSPTFIDNSTNNFTISAFGNSQPTQQNPFGYTSATTNGYTVSIIGGSGYFDGTGDYLTFPNNAVFAFGTGSYTIEFWINGPLNNDKFILSGRAAIGTMHITTGGSSSTAGVLRYIGSSTILSSNVITDNTWHHCAIVRNGSSNITLYVDGVSVGTGTDTTNYTNTTGTWYIASNDISVPSNIPTAYISDLRIVRGTAVYTSNFVPPAAPLTAVQNTVLLTNMTSAGIYDAAMMNNLETVGDAKLSTAVSKFGGSSMSFDGTGDWLFLPANTTLALGSGDFTVEMWMYPNLTYGSTYAGLLDSRTNADGAGLVYFGYTGTANQIGWKDNTTNVVTGTVTQSTWNHVAVVRSSGTMKLYINGTSVSTGSNSTNYTVPFKYIATAFDPFPFNGYIDDLRITKGYARYTANFTAPISTFKIK